MLIYYTEFTDYKECNDPKCSMGPRGVARRRSEGWKHMASIEREPITEVWGLTPSRVERQSPSSGFKGRSVPPKLFSSWVPNGSSNSLSVFCKLASKVAKMSTDVDPPTPVKIAAI